MFLKTGIINRIFFSAVYGVVLIGSIAFGLNCDSGKQLPSSISCRRSGGLEQQASKHTEPAKLEGQLRSIARNLKVSLDAYDRVRYQLDREYAIAVPEWVGKPAFDLPYLRFDGSTGILTARPGFIWDGCSGGIGPFHYWEGNVEPETGKPQTWEASLFHDLGYENLDAIAAAWGVPVEEVRALFDRLFNDLATKHRFVFARQYYWMLRIVGGVAHWWWDFIH